ncbi:MAG: PadR family transcriptional regulator [Planctomycetota bacterium]|jgi:DNA-binding PadR family transcriptional regulator
MEISKDLIAAAATPLILTILDQGENYGYAIIKRVRELSDGAMNFSDGMLYPVLHRLEKQKLIVSETRQAESGRMRKYYRIQKEGKKAIQEYKRQWTAVYATLKQVWEAHPCLS